VQCDGGYRQRGAVSGSDCIYMLTCMVPCGIPTGTTDRILCVSARDASVYGSNGRSSRVGRREPITPSNSSWILFCVTRDTK
jgi:hypothetical protein